MYIGVGKGELAPLFLASSANFGKLRQMNKVILCCGQKGCPVLRWKDIKGDSDELIMRFDDGTESSIKRGELELIAEALEELDEMRMKANSHVGRAIS